ncbi:cyclic phosphodiesterase-like [Zingiber officinale]|uniref:cyclic phosphodiesterase-like n=1 Tax=Zingiber officinale TaxID=94328 RepID=UPI001C4AF040|nr:cyclic phosphodiesterase-like [Zingiber officinale]
MAEDPTKAAKEVYSVWALPPDDVRDRIKRIMAALRSEFGGPAFEPHITVVGAISLAPDDALCRFRSACAALSRYPARVSAAARGTFFYQCVFLLVDPTPEVVATKSHSCIHFRYENSTPYMPHLSLLYADLPDEVKEKARLRVEELDKEITGINFEVAALALYRTDTEDKSLESWEPVEVYQLPPNPK